MNDYLKFEDIYELLDAMYNVLETDGQVSLVGDFNLLKDVVEILWEDDVEYTPMYIQIDRYEYDREYVLEIDGTKISFEPAYNYETERYYGVDGTVFVDDKVNIKFIKDVRNNGNIDDFTPVVFRIHDYEEDSEEVVDEDATNTSVTTCICKDQDGCGFTYCYHDGDGRKTEFKYHGSQKLSDEQIKKIIDAYC